MIQSLGDAGVRRVLPISGRALERMEEIARHRIVMRLDLRPRGVERRQIRIAHAERRREHSDAPPSAGERARQLIARDWGSARLGTAVAPGKEVYPFYKKRQPFPCDPAHA